MKLDHADGPIRSVPNQTAHAAQCEPRGAGKRCPAGSAKRHGRRPIVQTVPALLNSRDLKAVDRDGISKANVKCGGGTPFGRMVRPGASVSNSPDPCARW